MDWERAVSGQRVSQAKTFWEIPRAVSLAEKNSRPKPPGSGSRSVLGVCVWNRGLCRSGRPCWSCRTSERQKQTRSHPEVRVQGSSSLFLAPQWNHLLLSQLRPTCQSIKSALDLTGTPNGLWEQEDIRTLARPLSLQPDSL